MVGGLEDGEGVGSSVMGGRVDVDEVGERPVRELLRVERDFDIGSRVGRAVSSVGESGIRGSSTAQGR